MSRSTPEWIGKTDDTVVPPRVRAGLYLDAGGKCKICTRFIDGCKLTAQADHIIALINGGKNRESNLQLVCNECHAIKTKADVAEKATVYRKRLAHLGLKPKGRPMPGSKASGLRKRMDGTVERRT